MVINILSMVFRDKKFVWVQVNLSIYAIRAEKQTWGKWAKKPTQESHGLALCLLGCAFWFQVCSYGTWSASSERRSLYRDSTPTYIVPDSDIAIVLEKGKVRFSCILIYIYICMDIWWSVEWFGIGEWNRGWLYLNLFFSWVWKFSFKK